VTARGVSPLAFQPVVIVPGSLLAGFVVEIAAPMLPDSGG
jgi:hypothetical protein